jgi:hypothetical protein
MPPAQIACPLASVGQTRQPAPHAAGSLSRAHPSPHL